MKFKVGDKIEIPKTKLDKDSGEDIKEFTEELAGYTKDYLVVRTTYSPTNVGIDRDDNRHIHTNCFYESDLEFYTIEELKKAGDDVWVECIEEEAVKLTKSTKKGVINMGNYEKVHIYLTPSGWEYNPIYGESQKGKKIIQFNQVKFPEVQKVEERKIIGYKSPKDLFDQKVHKGELFLPVGKQKMFWRPENVNEQQTPYHLPKEIVEEWEPVYEELFKVGDWVVASYGNVSWCSDSKGIIGYITTITNLPSGYNHRVKSESLVELNSYGYDYAYFKKVRKATPKEIEDYKEEISAPKIGDYKAVVEKDPFDKIIAFGCVKLSLNMLLAYKYLLTSEAKAKITIKGTEITEEILNKLIKMIE